MQMYAPLTIKTVHTDFILDKYKVSLLHKVRFTLNLNFLPV